MPMETMEISGLSARPGTRARGFLAIPGSDLRLPLTLLNGVSDGPTLLVTAGVHGGEYPAIEAAIRFANELDPAALSGRVVVLPIVSPSSFQRRQAFVVPEDGKNLNRQFPGSPSGTLSDRIAHTLLEQVAASADAWIDMHGGDLPEALIPFVGIHEHADAEVRARTERMLAVYGIEHVVMPGHLGGTTLSAAADLAIPYLLVEAGQLGQRDEADRDRLLQGLYNVARELGILPGPPPTTRLTRFRDWPWLRADHSGCWYPAVALGDRVDEGTLVGVICDYFGAVLSEHLSPAQGTVSLLNTSLAINEGEALAGIGVF